MRVDVSLGRWKGATQWAPTIVKIGPGWWRFESGPLAIEVDDQPTRWQPPLLLLTCILIGVTL